MEGFLHTQSTTKGFLPEIKADSRRDRLLLLVAIAAEVAEQNKQADEVPTLYFLALRSTSYSCGYDEFSLEQGPKPQLFLYMVVLHKH